MAPLEEQHVDNLNYRALNTDNVKESLVEHEIITNKQREKKLYKEVLTWLQSIDIARLIKKNYTTQAWERQKYADIHKDYAYYFLVQTWLAMLKYELPIDGEDGILTRWAIRQFEKDYGLGQDAWYAGKEVLKKLVSLLKTRNDMRRSSTTPLPPQTLNVSPAVIDTSKPYMAPLSLQIDTPATTPILDKTPSSENTKESITTAEKTAIAKINTYIAQIEKNHPGKKIPVTWKDFVKLAKRINIKRISPLILAAIASQETLMWMLRNEKRFGRYNVGCVDVPPWGKPKNFRQGMLLMWNHLKERYEAFKARYPSVEPTLKHITTNIWPDGKWYMPNQKNYQKPNPKWWWAYCGHDGIWGDLNYRKKVRKHYNKISSYDVA
mgnify:CR=1 FL=1